MAKNQEWLDLVTEETLEPDLPICDPHHHLWDFRNIPGAEPYLLDDILADISSGHNVVSTVFIECTSMYRTSGPVEMRPVGETEFVNGVAAMSASGLYGPARVAAGIVGLADLTLGSRVAEVLAAHIQAGGGRFRGIRHAASWDASDAVRNSHTNPTRHLLAEPKFREGFAELAKQDLSFEGWIFHPQIADLTDLARAFPDTTIILNHFGGPLGIGPYAGKRDEVMGEWRPAIAELATCENVVAKLGGLAMKVNGFGWHKGERPPTSEALAAATRPYYEHCLEQFGVERCLFESNFPVDRASASYNVLWNSFKRMTADYSVDEKRKLYHDNAVRTYRL